MGGGGPIGEDPAHRERSPRRRGASEGASGVPARGPWGSVRGQVALGPRGTNPYRAPRRPGGSPTPKDRKSGEAEEGPPTLCASGPRRGRSRSTRGTAGPGVASARSPQPPPQPGGLWLCLRCGRREDDLHTECGACWAHYSEGLGNWWCPTCGAGPIRPGGEDACGVCGMPDPRRRRLVEEVSRFRCTLRGADDWADYAERALEGDREPGNRSSLELQRFLLGLRGRGGARQAKGPHKGKGRRGKGGNPSWGKGRPGKGKGKDHAPEGPGGQGSSAMERKAGLPPPGVCRYFSRHQDCPRDGCTYLHRLPGEENQAEEAPDPREEDPPPAGKELQRE